MSRICPASPIGSLGPVLNEAREVLDKPDARLQELEHRACSSTLEQETRIRAGHQPIVTNASSAPCSKSRSRRRTIRPWGPWPVNRCQTLFWNWRGWRLPGPSSIPWIRKNTRRLRSKQPVKPSLASSDDRQHRADAEAAAKGQPQPGLIPPQPATVAGSLPVPASLRWSSSPNPLPSLTTG